MAGSLDNSRTIVLGPEDYEWLVIHRGGESEFWMSKLTALTKADVARQLRWVAQCLEDQ